jgi:hypothetical protein
VKGAGTVRQHGAQQPPNALHPRITTTSTTATTTSTTTTQVPAKHSYSTLKRVSKLSMNEPPFFLFSTLNEHPPCLGPAAFLPAGQRP